MAKIEAILFDFGGTLDHDGLDWYARLWNLVRESSDGLDNARFDQYAWHGFNDICQMAGTSELLLDETIVRICEVIHRRIGADQPGPAWQPHAIAGRFSASAAGFVVRNRPTLEQLAGQYRLGCISNNWGNTAGWCRQFGLDSLFETMIDSTRMGCSKPDGRIFQAALDELNLPASACAYVGDRFDCDVLGARDAGLTPVWVRHPDATRYKTIENPDAHPFKPATIASVRELTGLTL